MPTAEPKDSAEGLQSYPGNSSRHMVFVFLILTLSVSIAGAFFYFYERQQFQLGAKDRLIAIAHWKMREIQSWRTERMRDAAQISTSPYNASRFARFLASKPGADVGNDLLNFLDVMKEKALYHDVMLADTSCRVRLWTTGAPMALSFYELMDFRTALRSREIYVADIREGEQTGTWHLNVYAPIWDRARSSVDSVIVGILILELNPDDYLFPMVRNWPTPSETGETILVRRDGLDMVYISRPRFGDHQPLGMRLSVLDNPRAASVMAGRGVNGVVTARDYRGARVLAALYRVPDSPWFLVTKIDMQEVSEPLRVVVSLILGFMAGLMLFFASVMLLWWKRREAVYLLAEYTAEKERRSLLERVAAERARAEEDLRHYNEKLERTVEERTARIRKLERERLEDEKQVALGRMAARIAHEINNPLTGIKNAFTLVKRAIPGDHRHYEFVELIDNELDRIARIVRQMFTLHRQGQQRDRVFRPSDAIRQVAMLLEGNARARDVHLEINAEGATELIESNEDMLRQVLFGIVQNGIEASPPGGHLQIAAIALDGILTVTVSDQGLGIPEDIRQRIFEPFFSTKQGLTTGGLGLGLSVTRGLLENAGGHLTFECPPGQGTTFTVTLPIRVPAAETANGG